MDSPLVEITGLKVSVPGRSILKGIDFTLRSGEIHCIVGESGSGKSTFASCLLGMTDKEFFQRSDRFLLLGQDVRYLTEKEWRIFRGKRISLVPQNPIWGFHPYRKTGSQIVEAFSISNREIAEKKKILSLLESIHIAEPEKAFDSLPGHLSGGERQRILILLAVYSGAQIVVADEPTAALDSISEAEVLRLLMKFRREKGLSLIFITHEISIVKALADTISILYRGNWAETFTRSSKGKLIPSSEYGKKLFEQGS
ncbi:MULTISPECIES: ATP-binding cassette domain-containing protein [Leptospira]|uniref:ABC transporter, ATP-binding protein n=5 Tax=Leptospira borgpetersenii TaxID=174 RepID=M3HMP1_LEPBO|nr:MULTISPECIES: ATP-binding cassette domain-containing protein [Leptospira]EMF98924.1 ABC transporter, ATP-binding protein [Leptospira borgpetersenii str. 200701203]EMO08392.1 ABC transporter, ATP-binding protein [Leptospira borgpetersenii str. Noumea 25]MBF3372708.1 ABC transporter ATP-binding protein [Leptospira borgpetersenii serovar Arborea]ALO25464.1 ABC transporter, ATP-binding protein [Leptospira borgpetersenii serovar Ballum]ANH00372.1 ABC transporter, ATP-binding protein [Leptospira 